VFNMRSLPTAAQRRLSTAICHSVQSRNCAVFLVSILLLLSSALEARESKDASAPAQRLFESAETLDVVLRLPWQAIVTDEFFYQGGYPSVLEVVEGDKQSLSIPVETERRGWSRQVICRYPPIKLRFEKGKARGTIFEGQKSLKLVIRCNDGEAYQHYVVLEALAYRMFNLLSEFSFRIRALSVTFTDSDTGRSERPTFAFLVEDDSQVASRNAQRKLKLATVRPEQLEPLEASKLALFQYMIGNTAWSLEHKPDQEECCDNVKLIGQDPEQAPIYAIPNDFDQSGLVNAPYAKPAGGPQANEAPERLFRGFCVHNAKLADARKAFLDQEHNILSLVENESRLADAERARATAYLEAFFAILESPEKFGEQITSDCRN